jgi:hypothetical protein
VAEIQGKVVKKGKRNPVSQLFGSKNDKDAIASWRQDLNRILHIFNVRSTNPVWRSLRDPLLIQTELLMNNNRMLLDNKTALQDNKTILLDNHTMLQDNKTMLQDNRTMLSDIHRDVLAGQEGINSRNQSVSATFYCAFNKKC